LSELESAALEAGIDPLLVRQAALELDSGVTPPAAFDVIQGKLGKLRVERRVSGNVSIDDLTNHATHVRNALGSVGRVEVETGAIVWRHHQRRVAVALVPTRSGSVIRVEESLHQLAGGLFGGLLGGLGGGLSGGLVALTVSLGSGPLLPITLVGLTLAGSFGLAHSIFLREARRRHRELLQLADDVSAGLES
jgi:hypothetical protein